ncbi:MAG TPA: hypothetical protein VIM11_06175 [Tepidisphaeraceae bacterium]|jgi:hypothetical protein
MRDLTGVVEQLRSVRLAQQKFLQMWAVEQTVILPGLDRVAADMNTVPFGPACWDSSGMADGNADQTSE